ncbi:hypothetical protein D3C72_1816680 [compost metagenome]
MRLRGLGVQRHHEALKALRGLVHALLRVVEHGQDAVLGGLFGQVGQHGPWHHVIALGQRRNGAVGAVVARPAARRNARWHGGARARRQRRRERGCGGGRGTGRFSGRAFKFPRRWFARGRSGRRLCEYGPRPGQRQPRTGVPGSGAAGSGIGLCSGMTVSGVDCHGGKPDL